MSVVELPAARGGRLARLALGSLLLGAGVLAPPARADDAKGAAKPAGPRTYALLIGCTEYPELEKASPSLAYYQSRIRLGGCVNDVEAMTTALVERLGVAREDVTALAGWPDDAAARPTESNVRKALEALGTRAYAKGDRVIVHYSGHGVQQPDDDGDESDGLDEAWLLADGRTDPATAYAGTLRDDELGRRLRAIRDRGATVWCVMDCCHSATGMRGATDPETRTRGLAPSVLGIDLVPATTRGTSTGHQDSPMDDARQGSEGLVVFYAAQSFQEVPEVRLPERSVNSKSFGLLTSAVVRALERAGGDSTFEGLYEQVVAGYRDMGKHNVVQPLAEGDLGQRLTGGPRGPATYFVRKAGAALELSAGALSGLAEGTELDVYPPGGAGDGATALGRVVLTDVRPDSAVVRPARASDAAWAKGADGSWPAKVSKYVVGETTLALAVVDAANAPVAFETLPDGVRNVLDGEIVSARFPRTDAATRAKWTLVVDAKGAPIALTPAIRGRAAPRFEVGLDTLEETLLTIFRGENLLKLCARNPDGGRLPGNLSLEVRLRGADGESAPLKAGQRVAPGSRLDLELVKRAARAKSDVETMDVYVFWIDPHYGVSMLYPERAGNSPRLGTDDVTAPGRRIVVGSKDGEETTDVSQGEERIVVFAAPARKDEPELRLEFLEQRALRLTRGAGAGPRDGIAALLDDLAPGAQGTRGVRKAVDRAATRLYTRVLTFETRWDAVQAPPDAKDQPSARIERPAAAPTAGASPDAWSFGPAVRLARARADGPWCFLVAREDGAKGATNVLVDVDDKASDAPRTKEGLARLVGERAFDAEIAIRLEPATNRVLVWYDVDDDGVFDRVLVDADDDLRAEERFRLVAGKWEHDADVDVPLLSTWNLEKAIPDEARDADDVRAWAIERLRALTGG